MLNPACPEALVWGAVIVALCSAIILLYAPYEAWGARLVAWISGAVFAASSFVTAYCLSWLVWEGGLA